MNFRILTLFIAFCCSSSLLSAQTTDTLVDLGTHELHVNIWRGEGLPIVFESGSGSSGDVWKSLADSIHSATNATVVTYDRAGYGRSEVNKSVPKSERGHIDRTVADLEQTLKLLGMDQEILLVAHAYGGFTAARFADRNPDLLKGIVLLDAHLAGYFTDEIRAKFQERSNEGNLRLVKASIPGMYFETLAFDQSITALKASDFPTFIPILDIVAATPPNDFNDDAHVELWRQTHRELIARDHNWIGFTARNSGHFVFQDQPEVVETAILALHKWVTRPLPDTDLPPILNGPKEDMDIIRAGIYQFSRNYENRDHIAIANSYTRDGKLFPNNRPILEGRETLTKFWNLPEGNEILHHQIYPREITITGDVAYDYGYYEGASMGPDQKLGYWMGKYVIMWKKTDEGWKMYLDIWNRI